MIEIKRTPEVEKWLRSLKDRNFGDVEPIGDGLSELRIHQGKGYRVYFGNKNNKIILLLCGGDKSTQQADIRKAKQIAKQWGF